MIGEYLDPRKEFGKAVTELAKANEKIVVLSADSGKSSGFGDFVKQYPDRYFECGIMEQGVIGVASGLATTGKIPVFCAIAPFVTARPFEMFRNDLGYMKQNVKVVGRNCGISYSDLGATHHSLEDFAIIRMIPGVVVLAPQDPTEIRTAVRAMIEHEGPVYMRIGNPKIPVLFDEQPFVIGKGRIIREGTDVTIISTGSTTKAAMEAADSLLKQGVSVRLIGMPTVCPIDEELVIESALKTKRIITVEEHYTDGGLGTLVSELCSTKCPVRVKRLGIPKTYASSGPYDELLAYYSLDAKGIEKSTLEFLK
ncbi:MAG TPA: transketolase C-terminal domain-containing protein [Clostridia bacterium]|nr:transketolase C-terminal domain-containing protein [Clostridia bacterium]